MLKPGIYEKLINADDSSELALIPDIRKYLGKLDDAEAPEVLSRYAAQVVRERLEALDGKTADRIALVNRIISELSNEASGQQLPSDDCLLALLAENDPRLAIGKKAVDLIRPETPMSLSSLFTGASHEPQMLSELKKEICSADRIDMLVSFIKWSGLVRILEELKSFTANGGQLRVITTSYMGATELRAVEELAKLPNTEVKVSYDTRSTRMHAKAYIFARDNGFTTAYIGSSNLSASAISSGLEWNLKVTAKDMPSVVAKVNATFESYWSCGDFSRYGEEEREVLREALRQERWSGEHAMIPFDIRPYPYQQEILDKLRAEREVRMHYRNLVVAATGTGKTVIAAFDYRGFRNDPKNKRARLLFIAHREEILKQSIETFRGILRDPNFGDLFVGGYRPESTENLFISVQTLASQRLWEKLAPDYYDYIVIDESHHSAAGSYQETLKYFRPQILLGLTATPERLDGHSILEYFDNRIAAEIRLPEAIDRKLLCPFQYFGVSDTVDLSTLRWTRGGYDRSELSKIYTMNRAIAEKRAAHIIECTVHYVADPHRVHGIGFCVSIEHAEFMADCFNQAGIRSLALSSSSSDVDRRTARDRLTKGDINFIFTVDLFNEGVDIPAIDTVLFLRPTESLTIFLQQLGRGLRLCPGKDVLTVLDFIGMANRRYSFDAKLRAMLTDTRHSLKKEIDSGFLSVPRGCFIQLERKAKEAILQNIAASLGSRQGLINRIQEFEEDSGQKLTLGNFMRYYHMDPEDLYRYDVSFSRLCVQAGVRRDFSEPAEEFMKKRVWTALGTIDSIEWINELQDYLSVFSDLEPQMLTDNALRYFDMLCVLLFDKSVRGSSKEDVLAKLQLLKNSPTLLHEMTEILDYARDLIDFVAAPLEIGLENPLHVGCTYSLHALLTGLDYVDFGAMRQGVIFLKEKNSDLFFITLNKSEKEYSPTTMYNDYSISDTLFHWQSQSTTTEGSVTGQRYIHHKERGSHVILFVREYKGEAYTCLGCAEYVEHTGSKPMNVTWRLLVPIPAKFLKKTSRLVG